MQYIIKLGNQQQLWQQSHTAQQPTTTIIHTPNAQETTHSDNTHTHTKHNQQTQRYKNATTNTTKNTTTNITITQHITARKTTPNIGNNYTYNTQYTQTIINTINKLSYTQNTHTLSTHAINYKRHIREHKQ